MLYRLARAPDAEKSASRNDQHLADEEVHKVNPPGVEFIQVCQGRNHILMLDSSGKVYGYGENTHFQIFSEGTQHLNNTSFNNGTSHRSHADFATPSQRSQKMSSVAKLDLGLEKGSEFVDRVQEVSFGEFNSVSIYKIHAFNNTSLAVDRGGDLYLWGENALSESSGNRHLKHPTQIREYKKIKISKERTQLLPDRISRVDEFQHQHQDQVLHMLDQYKANNSIQMAKFKQDIEGSRAKIAQTINTIHQKEQLVKNFETSIANYEQQLNKLKTATGPSVKEEQASLKEIIRNAKTKKEEVDQEIMKLSTDRGKEEDRIKEYQGKQLHVDG